MNHSLLISSLTNGHDVRDRVRVPVIWPPVTQVLDSGLPFAFAEVLR